MKSFAFIWQSEDLNMACEEIAATDLDSAWAAFIGLHGEQGCIAVLSGSDLTIEDFNE